MSFPFFAWFERASVFLHFPSTSYRTPSSFSRGRAARFKSPCTVINCIQKGNCAEIGCDKKRKKRERGKARQARSEWAEMIYKMDVVSFISFTLGASLSLSAGVPHFHAFHPLFIAVVRVSKVSEWSSWEEDEKYRHEEKLPWNDVVMHYDRWMWIQAMWYSLSQPIMFPVNLLNLLFFISRWVGRFFPPDWRNVMKNRTRSDFDVITEILWNCGEAIRLN